MPLVRAPRRPVLHPTLGHPGQQAPAKVLRGLSGADAGETTSRFARATRHQNREFTGLIHPLSGRLMGMARGSEASATPPLRSTRSQRRLGELAQHHAAAGNYELAERAQHAAMHTGHAAGPRPILIHNHPLLGSHTRHTPSALDLQASAGAPNVQMRVVSHEPHQPRGAPKTHVTNFGFHPGKDTKESVRRFPQLRQHDLETTPPGLTHRLSQPDAHRGTALQRRMQGLTRADMPEHQRFSAESSREVILDAKQKRLKRMSRGRPAQDYDSGVRNVTAGRQARRGGFYTNEHVAKRNSGLVMYSGGGHGRRMSPDEISKQLSLPGVPHLDRKQAKRRFELQGGGVLERTYQRHPFIAGFGGTLIALKLIHGETVRQG